MGLLVVVLAAGGGTWFLLRRGDAPPPETRPVAAVPPVDDAEGSGSGVAVTPTDDAVVETPAPERTSTEPEADPQQAALARLEEISDDDLTGLSLDNRYVAQLASKNPGIHDELQTTADGSHTFEATDILAEHQRLRDDPANGDVPVVLLRSTDFGTQQLYHGAPLYVTFALGDFRHERDVRSWCAARFPALSVEARANQCAVRRLRPPA
ncbi:hypothetical protein GCM10010166_64770 [Couchioplanes caeruleus subsp. azureus]|nr:hypothetical protein GCM10010166_64770 [Couchioplanes caeruleus subsp. azureus]